MKFQNKTAIRITVIILGILSIVIGGCGQTMRKQATTENTAEFKAAELFVTYLMNEEKLQLLFNDNWTFIYHADDRCDGSTDGQISGLSPFKVDEIIRIKVKNNGEVWEWLCDKKEPKEYYLDFSLKEHVKHWDRIKIADYENQEKNIVYINGGGESDYIKLYYGDNSLIVKMEYRKEDPG